MSDAKACKNCGQNLPGDFSGDICPGCGLTYWKFNKEKGRIDPDASFTFELPPYSQDLSDAGLGRNVAIPDCGQGYNGPVDAAGDAGEAVGLALDEIHH